MGKIIMGGIVFDQDKITKNTVRYKERHIPELPPCVDTIYIQKWGLGNPPPKSVKVTIEVEEP